MMHDESEFLAHVRANPDDDAPRLIFADWLDEQDQGERAEFIRLQCELARMPTISRWSTEDTKRQLLERREQQLFISLPSGLPSKAIAKCATMTRRGFVESVTCSSADWLTHGPAIVTRHPVQRVTLTDIKPEVFKSMARFYHPGWNNRHTLPFELWRAIRGNKFVGEDSQQAALGALSTACIRWALTEAGIAEPVLAQSVSDGSNP